MSLKTTLEEDMKNAMRARDNESRDLIRYVLAAVKNAEIDTREELTEKQEVRLIQTQIKQRQDSIEQFRAGNREDLAEKEEAQIRILEKYLPKQLDDAELAELVSSAIDESGAEGPKDMGKVMGLLKPKTEGRVDGRRLSSAVRDALAG